MTGSLNSDSSKTLSAVSLSASSSTSSSSSAETSLLAALAAAPHEFLQPPPEAGFHDAALALAKRYLDPLVKMGGIGGKGGGGAMLDAIYVDGFDVDQVWEQARAVVGAVESRSGLLSAGTKRKAVEFEEGEAGVEGLSGSESESGSEEEGEEADELDELGEEAGFEDADEDEEIDGLASAEEDEARQGEEEEHEEGKGEGEEEEAPELIEDVHGLNDGFFSIDDFNRQTELMELQDTRGENPVGSDDEEDIDMHADPNNTFQDSSDDEEEEAAPSSAAPTKKTVRMMDDYDESDEEDDGLDVDLGDTNANEIRYDDFFAPPARKTAKPSKSKKANKIPWREINKRNADELENELAATNSEMARVRRDLFDDDDDEDEFSGSDEDAAMVDGADNADPLARRSAHEKRQAELIEQIRALETENVAKKAWTLAGEARATTRPLNSLLEEDLDFERSGKPVPVITQEVTESLEELIKRRILAGDFDEVLKRRPDDVSADFRRGRVELDDAKPQQSLAEAYEKEHLAAVDPGNNPDANDEKLQKEHAEISALWTDVSRKLDALTSWHYTPKPPKPSLTVVADAPAISMEEAQPSAAAGGELAANVSMLAPQEVYNPRSDKATAVVGEGGGREIVGKSGAPVSTREMTSDEKRRRRRREKAKIQKRNAATGNVRGEVTKEGSKKAVVQDLKRGGVKVIGKEGEKRDVAGNLVKDKGAVKMSNSLKL